MSTRVVLGLAIVAVAVTAPIVVTGQAPTAAARATAAPAYKVPMTPWGHPDLQGTWDYQSITPLQRPARFGDREFLTHAEVKELETNAGKRMDEAPAEGAACRHGPPDLLDRSWSKGDRVASNLPHRRSAERQQPPRWVGRGAAEVLEGRAAAATDETGGGGRRPGRGSRWRWSGSTGRTRGLLDRSLFAGALHHMGACRRPSSLAFTTTTFRLCSRRRMWRLRTRWFTTPASFRSMAVPTCPRRLGSGWVIPARGGKGRRSSSKRGTSARRSLSGCDTNLHLMERFTRAGANQIDFRITVEDPTVWTAPWTAAFSMGPSEGPLFEYACHEGNYGLRNILENARDEEKAAAARERRAAAGKSTLRMWALIG